MANDLVVNLGARLDQFSADMNQAGDIADGAVSKIERSFASLNPGINMSGLAALTAGAVAGFGALMGLVASLNSGLDDMAKQAERVGLSFERFQQLKFGAAAIGIGDKAFGADMEAFTTNAQAALSKVNDLKRVFDANNVSITTANGKLKETNALFEAAVDVLKRAPTLGDALQIGGFLGISKDFAQAIYDAGDNFLRLASTANSVGAVIDDATIAKARKFTSEWNTASAVWGAQMKAATLEFLPLINDAIAAAKRLLEVVGMATSAIGAIKDFAFGVNVDTASLDKLQSTVDQMLVVRDKLAAGDTLNPIELFQASNAQENGELTVATVDKYLALLADRILNFNKSAGARVVISTGTPSVNPGIKSTAGGETASAYEREVDAITKKIAVMEAETKAAGTSIENRAAMTEQARLYTAAEKDGIVITEAYAKEIEALAGKYGLVAQKSAEAQAKVAAINQAYQTVGSAVSTAFADAIVEGKKLNEVLDSLVKTLLKASINTTIGAIFKGITPGGSFGFAGGTNFAPGGMALVGEQGPELVNLPRGSQVIPNDALRGGMGGSGQIVYSPAIDARGASVEAVARLAQIMEQDRASFATRTVATIQQARRARLPGV